MPYAVTCDTEEEAQERVTELTGELIGSGGLGGVGWESTTFSKFEEGGTMVEVLTLHDFQPSIEFNDPDLQEALATESERVEVILGDIEDVNSHRIVVLSVEVPADDDADDTPDPDADDPVEL